MSTAVIGVHFNMSFYVLLAVITEQSGCLTTGTFLCLSGTVSGATIPSRVFPIFCSTHAKACISEAWVTKAVGVRFGAL